MTRFYRESGSDVPLEIELVRTMIHLSTAQGDVRKPDNSWSFMLDDEQKIGYVRLTYFGPQSSEELRDVLTGLTSQGMKRLILDLRDNPGGSFSQATEIADLFVESGIIVSVKGRDDPGRVWFAKKEGTFAGFPMAVLVNGSSAGASEIVAACLQDHRRATVVGERTSGNAVARGIFPLEGTDKALRLTTAVFVRPSGRNLHRATGAAESDDWGVRPDESYDVKLSQEESQQYSQYRQERDVLRKEGPPKSDFKDRVLLRALDWLRMPNAAGSQADLPYPSAPAAIAPRRRPN